MAGPKLSVCITARDSAEVIRFGLESVTHPDVEIVVTDHGSTDGTGDIARQYTSRVQRVEVPFIFKRGEDMLKNLACDAASGDWVMILDSDEAVNDIEGLLWALKDADDNHHHPVLRLDHREVIGQMAPGVPWWSWYHLDTNLHARIFKASARCRFMGWLHVTLHYPNGDCAEPGFHVRSVYGSGECIAINHLHGLRSARNHWRQIRDQMIMRLKAINNPRLMRGRDSGSGWFNPADRSLLEEAVRRINASTLGEDVKLDDLRRRGTCTTRF